MKGTQRDHGYEAYMQEVHRYLGQVDRGRRVAENNPLAHRFSQAVEDQRQAARARIPYQAPPQATAPYSQSLSPQYGFKQPQSQGDVYKHARFEREMGASPWAKEYQTRYGEAPNLYAPEYDLYKAWEHGVQPTRDPYDQNSLHWPSRLPDGTLLKFRDHPTAWKEDAMSATGVNPDAVGLTKDAWEAQSTRHGFTP